MARKLSRRLAVCAMCPHQERLPGLIVVLGATNSPEGVLSEMAQRRLTLGLDRFQIRRSSGWKILLTGGFGTHFNLSPLPHAHYSMKWFLAKSLDVSAFVETALSRNTIEDALLSSKIIRQHGVSEIEIVTSDFHLARARLAFERAMPELRMSFWGSDCLQKQPADLQRQMLSHEQTRIEAMKSKAILA